jgi:hypothetical protein
MSDRAKRPRRNKIIEGLEEARAHARGEPTGMRVTRPIWFRGALGRACGPTASSRSRGGRYALKNRGFDYAAVSNLRRAVHVNRQPVRTGWQKRAVYSASVIPMT